MSIGPPIPEIQHFKTVTLKIQGQGHNSRSQRRYTTLSIHILLFHVNRPSHSWDTAILKFDIENSRSRSWVRSKFKVTTWVQHSVNSHPFRSMSIGHPISELRLFQNLTLKIEGQGHGWGQSWKSQHGSNIQSTHIPFVPCGSGIPFLSYDFFENLTLKIKGQGHGWGHSSKSQCGSNILSIHIPFVPCQSALPFMRYSIFKIWPWKSRVKVKWPWCCTTTGLDNSIELRMVQIHPGVSEIWVLQILAQVLPDLTSFWPMGKPLWGKWANNYDSAQLQVQTSPRNFKWGQSIQRFQRYALCKVWTQFVANLTSFCPMGKWPWQCTTTGLDNSTELQMEKIHQAVTEIWVPQVWQPPARPPGPWRQYPSSPEGWGVNSMVFREWNIITCNWIQCHFTVHNTPELGRS